ncbi:MAG: PQQ-binding-like beta-propeller repeat protein [Candidatus Bathyarchaeia archaeon]
MRILNGKTTLAAFGLFVLMTSVFLSASAPSKAQLASVQPSAGPLPSGATPSITITTEAYLSVSPNPIGVGQSAIVNMWLHPPIHVNRQFKGAFQVTITDPNGEKTVVGPIDSYAGDSTAWFDWPVDKVGTWKFKFDFLGMWFPAGRYYYGSIVTNSSGTNLDSAYYKPSSTKEVELVVQQEQVMSWQPIPLPTDYWERPVTPENREWWPILGNYPATGIVGGEMSVGGQTFWPEKTNKYMSNYNFIPYVQGPNSAHVVWKRQNNIGGLIGGAAGQISITLGGLTGSGYPTIVYSGRCYEVISKVNTTTNVAAQNFWRCYDLRTGEIYWERMVISGETIPTWIEYAKQGEEVPGASARAGRNVYLVAITAASGGNDGRILKYDPWTGAIAYNITGVPSGVSTGTVYGYPYVYSIQTIGTTYRLIKWNVENNAGIWTYGGGGAQTTVQDFSLRVKSNISWPVSSLGTCDFETGVSVVAQGISHTGTGVNIGQRLIGISLSTGQVLWNVTTDTTTGLETFFTTGTAVADHGKYAAKMQNGEVWAWDLLTGKIVWKSPLSAWPWGVFGAYHVQSAYGLLIHNDYDGVHAINWTNGKIEWSFRAPAAPFETPYNGQHAWHSSGVVADGKLYTFTCEHTPTQPLTRGWKLYCINMTNGQCIWNISCGQSIPGSRYIMGAVADGYLAYTNEYIHYLFVYGKGKSKTTVSAPQTEITLGQKVLLTGTVLDQSPAQPNTPCVSKDSMGPWMEYIHLQRPMPTEVTGVPVSIDAVDPNGNFVHLGDVTTDGKSGTFGFVWEPEIAGKYKITATFMGDDSYGSSFATTYAIVVEAPPATPTPEPPQAPPDTIPYIIGVGVAILIAIAIVGVLLLKKK